MPKQMKVPFEIKNEVANDVFILYLSGNVQKDSFWSKGEINAKSVRNQLDKVTTDIVIRLNSPGGDVFEGVEIYNYLKDHPSHITVEVTGTAASAASVIAMGADEVVMNTGTEIMIHKASAMAYGNDEDFDKISEMLKHTNNLIVDIYAEKTNQDKEQILSWMKEETYFNADDAIKYGFADGVKTRSKSVDNQIDIVALINQSVANSISEYLKNQKEQPAEPNKSFISKFKKGVNK